MCCFSGVVSKVSKTQIFARPSGDAQILVYSMELVADEELAMILPLPVPPRSPENAVRFINLESYPEFFSDLSSLFKRFTLSARFPTDEDSVPLVVHSVGLFEASFVPSIADFTRLDPRFRLPANTWRELPQYEDWGFAVFKLKPPEKSLQPPPHKLPQPPDQNEYVSRRSKAAPSALNSQFRPDLTPPPVAMAPRHFHPMAFEFPRRNPAQLFFPTVHIHDGQVHPKARFDHELYFQISRMPTDFSLPGTDSREILQRWASLEMYLAGRMEFASVKEPMIRQAAGMLHPKDAIGRWELHGELPNKDSVLEV